MIVQKNNVVLEAVDYELVWLGSTTDRTPVGRFGDVHHVESPTWRLVSGYLALAGDPGGSHLRISSHGHPVGDVELDVESCSIELHGEVVVDGLVVRAPQAGVALVADADTAWSSEGGALLARGSHGWGFTIVHGPADAKVRNRHRLLDSLARTGGRRG